jgi:membrane-associated phospholipid phosphatase
MRCQVRIAREVARVLSVGTIALAVWGVGCQTAAGPAVEELAVRGAIEHYAATRSGQLVRSQPTEDRLLPTRLVLQPRPRFNPFRTADGSLGWEPRIPASTAGTFMLGTFADQGGAHSPQSPSTAPPDSQPTTRGAAGKAGREFVVPDGYWRQDIWHQMGHESLDLVRHDFWHGFKTTFWDLPNDLLLTATLGGSIAIRGTGVDDTVRNRTHGSRALGDMDETIQILGHPGTHFAATGVLWLTSTLTKDVREHEVAKALTQALAVNGVTTIMLKAAANTRTPDGEHFGWPSGHTSSAFAAAAVLNEYYGPWVGVPSLALAGLVGYQRLDSRVHDFSDVVFGGMLGYVIGTSIARDEKAQFPELFGMKVIPYIEPESGASGLALLKQW